VALYRRLVLRTLQTAHRVWQAQNVEQESRFAGDGESTMRHWLGDEAT